MPARFDESFLPDLGHSPAVEDIVKDAASRVAARARANAPRDTGEYADSITVEVRQAQNRVVAVVVAKADHALIVESRSGTLARALSSEATG